MRTRIQPASGAIEIEVTVIGEIDWRGFITGRQIVNVQRIVVAEQITHRNSDIAGKALIAIFRVQRKQNVLFAALNDLPASLIKPFGAAMQTITRLIGRHLIGLTLYLKKTIGDTVRITSNGYPQVTLLALEVFHGPYTK